MASNPYQAPASTHEVIGKNSSRLFVIFGIVGVFVVLVPLVFCMGILALISAEGRANHQQYLCEKAEITPILASDPAFQDLEEREYSGGGAYITGRVDRDADVENLRSRLVSTFGEERAHELVRGVHTREMEKAWSEELTSPPPAPRP